MKKKSSMSKANLDEASFNYGWDEALDAFEESWKTKPENITRDELIYSTDRLLKLLRSPVGQGLLGCGLARKPKIFKK